MRLTSVDVTSVRNLSRISIEPGPGLNFFYGQNGAGKTSLLEAISILSSGRSFRPGRIGSIVQDSEEKLTVSAEALNDITRSTTRLGISRGKDKVEARIDGQAISRISDLAKALPCVSISTRNHELVEGGPSERRSFLDWILFHVDHRYLAASRRYRDALQQRNAALRDHSNDLALIQTWDDELAVTGELISQSRSEVIRQFISRFSELKDALPSNIIPDFQYNKGWPEDITLKQQLEKNINYCRRMNVTTAGPHRADLKIKVGRQEARYVNSRGQQKLLAILMRLVQMDLYSKHHNHPPVLLFDDLPSELDSKARKFVFEFLSASNVQVFLTGVDDISKEIQSVNILFHVKQGEIEKVVY